MCFHLCFFLVCFPQGVPLGVLGSVIRVPLLLFWSGCSPSLPPCSVLSVPLWVDVWCGPLPYPLLSLSILSILSHPILPTTPPPSSNTGHPTPPIPHPDPTPAMRGERRGVEEEEDRISNGEKLRAVRGAEPTHHTPTSRHTWTEQHQAIQAE